MNFKKYSEIKKIIFFKNMNINKIFLINKYPYIITIRNVSIRESYKVRAFFHFSS